MIGKYYDFLNSIWFSSIIVEKQGNGKQNEVEIGKFVDYSDCVCECGDM